MVSLAPDPPGTGRPSRLHWVARRQSWRQDYKEPAAGTVGCVIGLAGVGRVRRGRAHRERGRRVVRVEPERATDVQPDLLTCSTWRLRGHWSARPRLFGAVR